MSTHEQYSDIPRGQVVGTYDTYVEAQRAVDFLSDEQFPVQHVSIVGSDLKMVENVLGRLTRGRAAMAGAASGAWFGLFVGVLLSLFASKNTNGFGLVIAALLYGAVFGAIFGFVGHALSGGKRDFTSRSKIVASSYDVHCTWVEADKAREVLALRYATRRRRRAGRTFSAPAASGSRGCPGAATRASGTRSPVAARSGSDPGTPERPRRPRSSRRRG